VLLAAPDEENFSNFVYDKNSFGAREEENLKKFKVQTRFSCCFVRPSFAV